jgi:hypothetical protein
MFWWHFIFGIFHNYWSLLHILFKSFFENIICLLNTVIFHLIGFEEKYFSSFKLKFFEFCKFIVFSTWHQMRLFVEYLTDFLSNFNQNQFICFYELFLKLHFIVFQMKYIVMTVFCNYINHETSYFDEFPFFISFLKELNPNSDKCDK